MHLKFIAHNSVINCAFSIYSEDPISKFKIIEALKSKFGLNVEYQTSKDKITDKTDYYPRCREDFLGYTPSKNSLQNILDAAEYFLPGNPRS